MNLNTWQEAIALGFSDCGTLGTLMTLWGPGKLQLFTKYTILWDLGILSQDAPYTFSPSFLFASELLAGDPEMSTWMNVDS